MSGDAEPCSFDVNDESGWFHEQTELPFWGPMALRLLKLNRIPRHIAFIMDGNRRYARHNHLGSVVNGHSKGFDQLTKVVEWCNELGVKEITCYAFSLENFKRSDEEVNGLMELAERKFQRLLNEKDKLKEKRVRFRFFGNLDKLPIRLQKLIAEIELVTKDYDNAFINVCLAYVAQDEIVRGMERIREARSAGVIEEDITETLLTKSLDTSESFPVDMLVRTSGEQRLSDFLLWQCASEDCYLHFDSALWPDFGFYNLFVSVLKYQMHVISQNSKTTETSEALTVKEFTEFSQAERNKKWRNLIAETSN